MNFVTTLRIFPHQPKGVDAFRCARVSAEIIQPRYHFDQTIPRSAKTMSSCFSTSGDAGINGKRCSFALRTPKRLSMYLTGMGLLSKATPQSKGKGGVRCREYPGRAEDWWIKIVKRTLVYSAKCPLADPALTQCSPCWRYSFTGA